jgi:hypothetical protein
MSGKTKGKAEFVNFSFDVKFEGKGVARAFDLMLHNDKNTPPFPVIQGPVIVVATYSPILARDGRVPAPRSRSAHAAMPNRARRPSPENPCVNSRTAWPFTGTCSASDASHAITSSMGAARERPARAAAHALTASTPRDETIPKPVMAIGSPSLPRTVTAVIAARYETGLG